MCELLNSGTFFSRTFSNAAPGATSFPGTIGSTPPTSWWGHVGGDGVGPGPGSPGYGGGGGGGAGGAGTAGTPTSGGPGGVGVQLPTTFRDPASGVGAPGPTSPPVTGADTSGLYWVAGGGGGSGYGPNTNTPGAGGAGGGGDGSVSGGQDAVMNTGSGGGGNERAALTTPAIGRGGSGIVIVAYPT